MRDLMLISSPLPPTEISRPECENKHGGYRGTLLAWLQTLKTSVAFSSITVVD